MGRHELLQWLSSYVQLPLFRYEDLANGLAILCALARMMPRIAQLASVKKYQSLSAARLRFVIFSTWLFLMSFFCESPFVTYFPRVSLNVFRLPHEQRALWQTIRLVCTDMCLPTLLHESNAISRAQFRACYSVLVTLFCVATLGICWLWEHKPC